ncbi:MAG: HEAT repeat domain-containing protein, partial [Alphaproteobacteria bacterium]
VAADMLLAALRGDLVAAPPADDDADGEAEDDQAACKTDEAPEGADDDAAVAISAEDEPEPEPEAVVDDDAHASADPEGEVERAVPTSTLQAILGEGIPRDFAHSAGDGVELSPEDIHRLATTMQVPAKKVVSLGTQAPVHQDVRRFAARVLGDLPRAEVADELATALSDKDMPLRMSAADSLACIAEAAGTLPAAAIDALLATFDDPERELRLSAIRALGAQGGEQATTVLIARLRDDDSFVRCAALHALAGAGTAGPEVEALLEDSDPQVRLEAAGAVTAAGGAGATDQLIDFAFAFEGHHRRQAGRALRGLDTVAANRRFLEVLDDPDRKILWAVAIEALEELNRRDDDGAGAASEQIHTEEAKPS